MDTLSRFLSVVRLNGAIFFNVECTAPFGFTVPATRDVETRLVPGRTRLINYHLVTQGRARVRLRDDEEVTATAGDVVILAGGDAHSVRGGTPKALQESRAPLEEVLSGRPRTIRMGGGGEPTTIVCGFLGCEEGASRLLLDGLPPVFVVSVRSGRAPSWIERSIRHLVTEAESQRPGASVVLAKMAEVLFVEGLRRYMDRLPEAGPGWLAAARDPVVGRALRLLHEHPEQAWTIAELARGVGASRSVLGERFRHYLGVPPLTYLTRWRLVRAAQELERTGKTVAQIAADVGYRSEASFSRAFKREVGVPPSRYRRESVESRDSQGMAGTRAAFERPER